MSDKDKERGEQGSKPGTGGANKELGRPTHAERAWVGEQVMVYSAHFAGGRPGVVCEVKPDDGLVAVQAFLSPRADHVRIVSNNRGVSTEGFSWISAYDRTPLVPPMGTDWAYCVRQYAPAAPAESLGAEARSAYQVAGDKAYADAIAAGKTPKEAGDIAREAAAKIPGAPYNPAAAST